jgi:phosphatidylserine/phosphatidylglycerophosphate/cardiolipin synthase-like enzyme
MILSEAYGAARHSACTPQLAVSMLHDLQEAVERGLLIRGPVDQRGCTRGTQGRPSRLAEPISRTWYQRLRDSQVNKRSA